MGAAGRDFHNFNTVYRHAPEYEVVAFTAAQIPGIADRRYPASLSGLLYPEGIPILSEDEIEQLCSGQKIDQVIFAYSDLTHEAVMHLGSRVLSHGPDYVFLGPKRTMLKSAKPVISVTAIRTGCGKSQTSRYIARILMDAGQRVAIVRHPMPYGDLERQRVQHFVSIADLDEANCTNEEREEYEPHIMAGGTVFAGVDYGEILASAEKEADIIIWDGGNNDFSFYTPDLNIVLADAMHSGQANTYHPGETVLRMADVIILNKVDSVSPEQSDSVARELKDVNPSAVFIRAASPVTLDDPNALRNRRVLIIEDGPTITHGGRPYGAGYVAAVQYGASEIIDPRNSAAAEILAVFEQYPHIGPVLPDVGYTEEQRSALRDTIARSAADVILVASPIDLAGILPSDRPSVRARYSYADAGEPTLAAVLDRFLADIREKK